MIDIQSKIADYFSRYQLRKFPKGQILFFPDDVVEHVYFVKSGTIKQYGISRQGDEVILNIFKPGAFFPMANVINDIPAKYMIEVEADAELRVVPKADAINFLKDNPDVVYDLLSRVYRGTEGLLGRLEHLMSGTAESRLVYELLIEAKRFGQKINNGAITISISESSLGQRAGLTRESVNRVIRNLKSKKLIQIQRNAITIPDLTELEKIQD